MPTRVGLFDSVVEFDGIACWVLVVFPLVCCLVTCCVYLLILLCLAAAVLVCFTLCLDAGVC